MRKLAISTPSLAALRARVKERVHEHGEKIAFGRAVGMRPSSVTAYLAGESNPTADKLDAIARYLGLPLSEAVQPVRDVVQKSVGVTHADPPMGVESAPHHLPGGALDASSETGLLRAQLATATKECAALRKAVKRLARQLLTVADAGLEQQARHPATKKSHARVRS